MHEFVSLWENLGEARLYKVPVSSSVKEGKNLNFIERHLQDMLSGDWLQTRRGQLTAPP